MIQKKIKVFFDMDGVLYEFDKNASIEETFERGFFLSRKKQEQMIATCKALMGYNVEVAVLSSVYENGFAAIEKRQSLANANVIANEIFVPYGRCKAEFINDDGESIYILIDDFSKNLISWEAQGSRFIGIKCLNGINGTKGTWFERGGYCLSKNTPPDKAVSLILGIAEKGGE